MTLSLQQVEQIRNLVSQKVSLPSLGDDLLDHLCCAVEDKLENGLPFDEAVEEAILELAPAGLTKIQHQTIALITNQTILHMKKIMYAIGLATTMSMAMGLMMKLLHMPGGEQLINFGFLSFSLLFLPMMAINHFKKRHARLNHEKFKMIFGYLSAIAIGLAIVFKMQMSLDVAEALFMMGASLFSFGFLPLLFFGMYKKSVRETFQL
jgi:hypothetical protein